MQLGRHTHIAIPSKSSYEPVSIAVFAALFYICAVGRWPNLRREFLPTRSDSPIRSTFPCGHEEPEPRLLNAGGQPNAASRGSRCGLCAARQPPMPRRVCVRHSLASAVRQPGQRNAISVEYHEPLIWAAKEAWRSVLAADGQQPSLIVVLRTRRLNVVLLVIALSSLSGKFTGLRQLSSEILLPRVRHAIFKT